MVSVMRALGLTLVCMGYMLEAMSEGITPHKLSDPRHLPAYTIPSSARHTAPRQREYEPPVVYYFSKPKSTTYPIAILCGGSSSESDIFSIIHFHRYFLQEFMDMGAAVITIEQWGVDGNAIDKRAFMEHYTRSQRLYDHIAVIEQLMTHPPEGWNGKFIFLGVSEGSPLVTSLSGRYQNHLIATINWCGAGHWNWREQIWEFIEDMKKNGPWWVKSLGYLARLLHVSSCFGLPITRLEFDKRMNEALQNPTTAKKFMDMTYKYHADALTYPICDYAKLCAPFLVVAGTKDPIIDSCDEFVEKALDAGANITYLRVNGMDHYIRRRPDIIEQSFLWLKGHMEQL